MADDTIANHQNPTIRNALVSLGVDNDLRGRESKPPSEARISLTGKDLRSNKSPPILKYSCAGACLTKRPDDSGYDIRSSRAMTIAPGETKLVSTGLFFEIPKGYEIQVRSRSGLAGRGIVVANSPGTVDASYRGECGVILRNCSDEPFCIAVDDRIAQVVLCKVAEHEITRVSKISKDTDRGEKGFGSSGVE